MRPLLVSLLIVALSACSLNPTAPIAEIELTVIYNTAEPELPTFTPQPAATATRMSLSATPANTSQARAVLSDCTPRTDLTTYMVVVGDSLSSIAVRTNSSVPDLMEWNCLANANMIVVGMRLQVAHEASPPTLTPSPTPLPTNTSSAPIVLGPFGALAASPAIQAGRPEDWTDFVIDPQQPITIHWSGIDPEYYVEVGQIEFFYLPDSGSRISIGIDSNKNDGMSITWTAPSDVTGRVTVTARYGANGSIISPAIHLRVEND
jgi:hypothetical protein